MCDMFSFETILVFHSPLGSEETSFGHTLSLAHCVLYTLIYFDALGPQLSKSCPTLPVLSNQIFFYYKKGQISSVLPKFTVFFSNDILV